MAMFNFFKNKIRTQARQEAMKMLKKSVSGLFESNNPQWGGSDNNEFSSNEKQLQAYEKIAWASICSDAISDKLNRPFIFTDKDGEEIPIEQIDDSITFPLRGFANMSLSQIISKNLSPQKNLTGNAYMYKSTSTVYGIVKGVPDTLIPVAPDMVKVCVNTNITEILYYEIKFKDGKSFKVPPELMIHFKQNCVYNPFIGIGTIEKLKLLAQGEAQTEIYKNNFLINEARPSLIITDKNGDDIETDEDELDRYVQNLRDKYEGKANSGKLMYVLGVDPKVETAQFNHKDMQLNESHLINRQTIISAFGCNPVVVGIPTDINKATSQVFEQTFLKRKINPELDDYADTINTQFIHPLNPDIYIKFLLYPTGDTETIKEQIKTGVMSPNEGRKALGLAIADNPAMDMYYIMKGLIPIEQANLVIPAPVIETPKFIHNHDTKEEELLSEPMLFQWDFVTAARSNRSKIENKYTDELSKFFKAQGKRVIAAFEKRYEDKKEFVEFLKADEAIEIIFSIPDEDALMKSELKNLHTSAVTRAYKDTGKVTGSSIVAEISNPGVQQAISQLSLASRITKITDVTRDRVKKVLEDGIKENFSVKDFSNALQSKFTDFSGYRSRLIARTEAMYGYDAGALNSYKELDVKEVDLAGCTEFEANFDCGIKNVPVSEAGNIRRHPNCKGSLVPSREI